MPKKVITETRLYPVVIHREGDVWGYASPEFGGGGAVSFADALQEAQEMIQGEVAHLGDDAPMPSDPNAVDADGGQIAWLPVTVSNAAERVFITIPKSLLAQIDAVTSNRSAFFAELAKERVSGV
jgi:hypothetical protein